MDTATHDQPCDGCETTIKAGEPLYEGRPYPTIGLTLCRACHDRDLANALRIRREILDGPHRRGQS